MIAVIGDMIKSRSISDRYRAQQVLQEELHRINLRYQASLASKFTVTLGDEFQGLIKNSHGLLRLLDEISFALLPIRFRFGIGIGTLNTEIDPTTSLGADGPAYWKAREAIDFVHKYNDYGRANVHLMAANHHESIGLINEILKLTAFQMSGWRDSQLEVYRRILSEGILDPDSIKHREMAEQIGISPSALTRRFESSGIKRYMLSRVEAEAAIERINELYE